MNLLIVFLLKFIIRKQRILGHATDPQQIKALISMSNLVA